MSTWPVKQLGIFAWLLACHCLVGSLAQNTLTLTHSSIDWSVDFTATYCVDGSGAPIGGRVVINMVVANEFINRIICYKWANGTSSSLCSQSDYFDFVFDTNLPSYLQAYSNNVVMNQSDYTWRVVPYTNTAPSYIEISIPVTAALTSGCSVKTTYRPTPRTFNSVKYAGSVREFSGSYQILSNSAATVSTGAFAPVNLTITGPRVQLASSTNATAPEAGDSVRISLTVTRHSQASVGAFNTFVSATVVGVGYAEYTSNM